MSERINKIQAIKGVRDILPPESALWNRVEETARRVFSAYGYGEIRLPILERARLFERSVGADTEIVSKELHLWIDSPRTNIALTHARNALISDAGTESERVAGARRRLSGAIQSGTFDRMGEVPRVVLRPEATASVVRAYIEHGMHTWPGDVKLYYIGPMFRRERPQKGRYRQFYQIGAEVLGQSDHAAIDADVIEMLMVFLAKCGLTGCKLEVNSIGCKECRPRYVAALKAALEKVRDRLGPDSQRRIDTNPLRVLDSKLESEQAIIEALPRITDHLCDPCRTHFDALRAQLHQRGIDYAENTRLVRGLDYYMRTTFEITAPGLGAQNAVCGGGRYDGLVELLGGPPTKGIGFAIGTDRLILSLMETGVAKPERALDVFITWMGAASYPVSLRLARILRDAGLSVELPAAEMKFKKSLGLADKLGARFALIIGEDEVTSGQCTLKELATGEQTKLDEGVLLARLAKK